MAAGSGLAATPRGTNTLGCTQEAGERNGELSLKLAPCSSKAPLSVVRGLGLQTPLTEAPLPPVFPASPSSDTLPPATPLAPEYPGCLVHYRALACIPARLTMHAVVTQVE